MFSKFKKKLLFSIGLVSSFLLSLLIRSDTDTQNNANRIDFGALKLTETVFASYPPGDDGGDSDGGCGDGGDGGPSDGDSPGCGGDAGGSGNDTGDGCGDGPCSDF